MERGFSQSTPTAESKRFARYTLGTEVDMLATASRRVIGLMSWLFFVAGLVILGAVFIPSAYGGNFPAGLVSFVATTLLWLIALALGVVAYGRSLSFARNWLRPQSQGDQRPIRGFGPLNPEEIEVSAVRELAELESDRSERVPGYGALNPKGPEMTASSERE